MSARPKAYALGREELLHERLRPLRRREYDQLIELGLLEGEPVELLGGLLVARSSIGGPHNFVVRRLVRLLTLALADRAIVQGQGPLAASDDSEPEPDVLLIRPEDDSYSKPTTGLLVVEVSSSSLALDRGFKRRLYASIGIADYWIVNLLKGVVEVYRHPRRTTYARCTVYRRGQSIALHAFPDVRIAVGDLLP